MTDDERCLLEQYRKSKSNYWGKGDWSVQERGKDKISVIINYGNGFRFLLDKLIEDQVVAEQVDA